MTYQSNYQIIGGIGLQKLTQTYSKNKDRKHKIEDNVNKYTFVWKKKVNKFYEKLKIKINNFWYLFNENNNTEFNDIQAL